MNSNKYTAFILVVKAKQRAMLELLKPTNKRDMEAVSL